MVYKCVWIGVWEDTQSLMKEGMWVSHIAECKKMRIHQKVAEVNIMEPFFVCE